MKTQTEPKMIVTIGYQKIVMQIDHAVTMMQLLSDAESFDTRWHCAVKDDEGNEIKPSYTTKHVFPFETLVQGELLSAEDYAEAKQAGKPKKD